MLKSIVLSLFLLFVIPQYVFTQDLNINSDTSKLQKLTYQNPQNLTDLINFAFDNHAKNTNNALKLINFSINRSLETKNAQLYAKALNVKGVIYNNLGNFSLALKFYLESLKIFEKGTNNYSTAMVTNNVGRLFLALNNYKDAERYFKDAESIAVKNELEPVSAIVYSNLANLYIAVGKLDLALNYALKSDQINDKVGNKSVQNVNANNIGALYFYKDDFNNALKYYQKAQKLSKESGDLTTYFRAEWNIGEVYFKTKNEDALPYYQNALIHFKNINDDESIAGIYEYISNYYTAKGDDKNAFENYKKSVAAKELNTNLLAKKNLAQLQTQYETEKKELKIGLLSKSDSIKTLTISKNLLRLTQQNLALTNASLKIADDSLTILNKNESLFKNRLDSIAKSERINDLTKSALLKQLEINKKNTLLVVLSLVFIIIAVIVFGVYKRKKAEQERKIALQAAKQREQLTKAVLDAEENERKRIGSDLHDGVGQLFSAVKMNLMGLIDRVNFETTNEKFLAEKTLALVDESCKEVRIISHKMMPNALLKSGIASDIKSFIEKLDEENLKVNFEANGFSDQLEHNEEVILYKVIQELVSNIIKHAKATELTIKLVNEKTNIKAKIKDNGVGFDLSKLNSFEGIGLKNIKTRIDYLKGKIDFITAPSQGTEVNIFVPLS